MLTQQVLIIIELRHLMINVDLIAPAYLTNLTKDLQIIAVPQNFSQQTTLLLQSFFARSIN